MTSLPERLRLIRLIGEAVRCGAGRHRACRLAGISLRTLQRWRQCGTCGEDRRPSARRPAPANRLTEAERNPYSESLFRTLKYCPQWPREGFSNVEGARRWVYRFVQWYNTQHRHSGLRWVTPDEKHYGLDVEVLAKRHELYEEARRHHPERWSGKTRNWNPVMSVSLNPEKTQRTA